MKLTLQLVVVVLIAPTKFRDNLFKFTLYAIIIYKVGNQETIKGTERASPIYTLFHR